MRMPELLVVALSNDPVFVHQDSANHRVGRNQAGSGFSKLEATHHIPFVNRQSMKQLTCKYKRSLKAGYPDFK
jgi:hypothetical protein